MAAFAVSIILKRDRPPTFPIVPPTVQVLSCPPVKQLLYAILSFLSFGGSTSAFSQLNVLAQ